MKRDSLNASRRSRERINGRVVVIHGIMGGKLAAVRDSDEDLVWVKTMVPETKGVPLEKIQEKLGISAVPETKRLPPEHVSSRPKTP